MGSGRRDEKGEKRGFTEKVSTLTYPSLLPIENDHMRERMVIFRLNEEEIIVEHFLFPQLSPIPSHPQRISSRSTQEMIERSSHFINNMRQ